MSKKQEKPKRETGWDKLRQENEENYVPNFTPLLGAIRRNEFLGSLIELFLSAIVGVGKINLGAEEPKSKQESKPLK